MKWPAQAPLIPQTLHAQAQVFLLVVVCHPLWSSHCHIFFGPRNHMKFDLECDMKRQGPSRSILFLCSFTRKTFTNTTPLPSLHHCWKHMLQTVLFYLAALTKSLCCACQAWDARSHARERVGTTRLTAITLGHSRLVACARSPDRMASVRKHVLAEKHHK